jgi:hypothetical protein
MKTEERKKEDCELLDDYREFAWKRREIFNKGQSFLWQIDSDGLEKFKADNDLLPKPKLDKWNKWLVSDTFEGWFNFYDKDKEIQYGLIKGEWCLYENTFDPNSNLTDTRLATEDEILERLSAMAVKMGYVEGVEIQSFFGDHSELSNTGCARFNEVDREFWTGNCCVMQDGKWAKIISTPKLELSKEEWYERIGIDKHIEAITNYGYVVTLEKK